MAVNNTVDEVLSQLQTITSMVMHASEADTLQQVLQRIADSSRRLIGARYAALGIPDGNGGLAFFKVSGISPEEIEQIAHPPVGRGLLGEVMNERHALRLPDMHQHPRAAGFPEGHPEMTSFLGVPVMVDDSLFGMLYLTDRIDGRPFEAEDQWLIESLAGYAALAISNVHIREQQRQITLLRERERISMELHDGVIQNLYAIGMQLDLARRTESSSALDYQGVTNSLNQVIDDIRSYIMQLRTTEGVLTTRACLEDLVNGLHIPDTLRVEITANDHPPPLAPAIFESLCMVVNEALSNVIRHADASVVRIRARIDGNRVAFVVEDDGVGFDPDAPMQREQGGLGLSNLRARARLYKGHVNIESAPGEGTRVVVRVPLREL